MTTTGIRGQDEDYGAKGEGRCEMTDRVVRAQGQAAGEQSAGGAGGAGHGPRPGGEEAIRPRSALRPGRAQAHCGQDRGRAGHRELEGDGGGSMRPPCGRMAILRPRAGRPRSRESPTPSLPGKPDARCRWTSLTDHVLLCQRSSFTESGSGSLSGSFFRYRPLPSVGEPKVGPIGNAKKHC